MCEGERECVCACVCECEFVCVCVYVKDSACVCSCLRLVFVCPFKKMLMVGGAVEQQMIENKEAAERFERFRQAQRAKAAEEAALREAEAQAKVKEGMQFVPITYFVRW